MFFTVIAAVESRWWTFADAT